LKNDRLIEVIASDKKPNLEKLSDAFFDDLFLSLNVSNCEQIEKNVSMVG